MLPRVYPLRCHLDSTSRHPSPSNPELVCLVCRLLGRTPKLIRFYMIVWIDIKLTVLVVLVDDILFSS